MTLLKYRLSANRRRISDERAIRLRREVGVVWMIGGERCSKKITCDAVEAD